MKLTIYDDLTKMPLDVDAFLMRDPLTNNIPFGVLERMRRGTILDAKYKLMVIRDSQGAVIQYAHLMPPHPLCLSLGAGAAFLKIELASAGITYDSVQGTKEQVETFLSAGETSVPAHVERQGFYKLTRVIPGRATGARFVQATEGDLEILVEWSLAFVVDCDLGTQSRDLMIETFKEKIKVGDAFLLKQGDQPVSMVCATRSLPKGRAVSFVYTPNSERRKGYAAELTEKVSSHLLAQGNEFTCLFTQLDNSTTNRIYQDIGYEWVCEFLHVKF